MLYRTHRLTLAFLCAGTAPAAAQAAARLGYDSAYFAWQAGNYVESLERMERLLSGPARDTLLAPIALLTGELFRTRAIAPDASSLRWSPDGSTLAYEIGRDSTRRTVLLTFTGSGPGRYDTLPGYAAAFSPGGSELAYLAASRPVAVLRSRADGSERTLDVAVGRPVGLVYSADSAAPWLLAASLGTGPQPVRLYRLGAASPTPLPGEEGVARTRLPQSAAGGRLVYASDKGNVIVLASDGTAQAYRGNSPSVSPDGQAFAFVGREGEAWTIMYGRVGSDPRVLARSPRPLSGPTISGDGSLVAWQAMLREDLELFVADTSGGEPRRLTREIQHDLAQSFMGQGRLLGLMGEPRHRRSYLYDLETGTRTRVFHNNTVRTIAPEYDWAPRPGGQVIAIVSDRDGDTVSPERGLYLTDLRDTVTTEKLLERVRVALRQERELRNRGTAMYAPVAARLRPLVADVSSVRIYEYARALYSFDSKHVTMPGNQLAIEYLQATLRSFGYEPELQWFEPMPGVRSANVIATLRGTANPELQYVVGSHFDSVREGPGADDNSSGSTALLEVARVLARHPQAATIRFVWFTGEESGLLGSREFVRVALQNGDRVVGALNNDMLGWMNDDRLDNTIRYINPGLRDLQHAAAFLFTGLITYDARYYRNTDAHSLVDGFGPVVSGIGSYPVLGNPHYHQAHDVLETVDQRLVAEVARTTLASVVLMASSPAPVAGLTASRATGGSVDVSWKPAAERGVASYRVQWEEANGGTGGSRVVRGTAAKLTGVPAGARVAVRAIGPAGVEGWDWSRTAPVE